MIIITQYFVQDPVVVAPNGDRLNLELYSAGDVMAKPVHTLRD